MKYELDILEKLIIETLKPAALQQANTEAVMSGTFIAVHHEKERLRKAFINASYKCKEQRVFLLYIQHHQNHLIAFANQVYHYESIAKLQETVACFINCIDELLHFLQNNFKGYFDVHVAMPVCCCKHAAPELNNYTNTLKKLLKKNSIDLKLCPVIIEHFESCIDNSDLFSYHRYAYLKQLFPAIVAASGGGGKAVIECLCHYNFNSYRFFSFYIQYMQQLLAEVAEPPELLLLLNKENNQLIDPVYTSLHAERMSIKDMVGNWLYEEQQIYELRRSAPITAQPVMAGAGGAFKAKVELSVDETGYLLDLLYREKVYDTNSRKALYKMIAPHCSTKERANVAWNSLYKSAYDVSPYTRKIIKDLFIRLINRVNRNE